MPSPYRTLPDRFLVAFSFAGEQRELVRSIAEAVEQRLGRGTVFYDGWFQPDLAGSAADLKLQRIYAEQAELVVFCPSQEYGEKPWTIAEWDAIRTRHMQLRADPDRNAADRILPLRVADGDVEGLLENAIWVDARKCPPKQTAELIVHRLRRFVPDAGKPHVFLAECTPDLEDEEKPVNRQRLQTFLTEDLDWVVLPRSPLTERPSDRYRSLLEENLRQCLAFVQLLGPYPWKGGAFDRLQHDAAAQLDLPMFRFRGAVDLAKLERTNPAQQQFLTSTIAGGFEDFKVHLRAKLPALAQQWEETIKRAQEEEKAARGGENPDGEADIRPVVRVVIRAGSPRALWEQVFQLLDGKRMLPDELGPGKSLIDTHGVDPCHGFLILCDAAAVNSETLAPREYLAQCRQIQMRILKDEKDPARCPPVGLIYWPPPDVSWPWLLRSEPQRLHRILGNALQELEPFFEQVRQVRRATS